MNNWTEEQIRLLTEVMPGLAAHLRSSMGPLALALPHLATPERRAEDHKLDQDAAIAMQSYYRIQRLAGNLSAAPLLVQKQPLLRRNEDVAVIVDQICREADGMAWAKGVKVTFCCQRSSHVAAVAPQEFRLMLWNLLSNAVKFTDAGGEVNVTLHLPGQRMVLTVADTGCGITPELMDTVYDRWLHTERMDLPPHGMGLGLPLCRAIAEGHGGGLLITSRVGKGTTVTVSLPDERVSANEVSEYIVYGGGTPAPQLGLSDAMPYQAYLQKNTD